MEKTAVVSNMIASTRSEKIEDWNNTCACVYDSTDSDDRGRNSGARDSSRAVFFSGIARRVSDDESLVTGLYGVCDGLWLVEWAERIAGAGIANMGFEGEDFRYVVPTGPGGSRSLEKVC